MANQRIRVGIAGFGMSGKIFQAPFLNADERFEIKKVYERSTERSKEEYPYIEVVHSFEELLTEEIDLVIISTPNQQHVPMARQAIEAGKSVIVEKPMAATAKEAEELCKLAKKKGVLLSVYQNRRFDGDFLTVKQLIETGALGEVLDYETHYDRFVQGASSKRWKAEGGTGVGLLYDLGVHIIDQAYSLFGMPEEVYADFRKQRSESVTSDNFEVILYYKNVKAILSAGEVVVMQGPHYVVNGRKGTYIKYGMDVQEKALLAGERPPMQGWGAEVQAHYGSLYRVGEDGIKEEKIQTITGDYGKYYDNIYQVMTRGAELFVKPEQAVEVLKIIEAAQRSQREKRRITL